MPLADLAVILVAHPQVTYTQAVLSGLAAAGGVFVACDGRNLPVGMMLPLAAHHAQAERFAAQARAPLPVRKRLWRQIVRAKINAQAALLVELRGTDFGIEAMAGRVHSGDPSNVEARAARRYWPRVFADLDFRRHRENEDQNVLLNYGYAVLRAIVARAICAAGLHPSLGIHHHNRYDAFCLADDLMEPFRPAVDRAVAEYMGTHDEPYKLEAAAKQQIIGELTGRYDLDGAAADPVRRGRPAGRLVGRRFPGQCRGIGVARLVDVCGAGVLPLVAMPRQELVLSGYRGMWLFAMFDLPVTTAQGAETLYRVPQGPLGTGLLDATILGLRSVLRKRGDGRRLPRAHPGGAPPGGVCPRPGRHRPAVRQNGELHRRNEQIP